ncbi:MAG: alanine dehydrogenase [Bacteroidales bacterium]|nr:alanine dehydrogenase [Bacteroidales bacterium]
MNNKLKVGILRETKTPPDRRVPLTPAQVKVLIEQYPDIEFYIQPSDFRCFADNDYRVYGIPIREDLSECDILMGIKEVDKDTFIPGRTYIFFAHVGKKQPYNREMFREMASKNDSLIDYEYLTTDIGQRVIAFGRWAGIIGAYNGLRAVGLKSGRFKLRPAHLCNDLNDMWNGLGITDLPPGFKILVTGGGRVSGGAVETLNVCRISQADPHDFLSREYDTPVFCQIGPEHYTTQRGGHHFDMSHFIRHPEEYGSAFLPYSRVTDLLITGHFWDPRSPVFFSRQDMKNPEFRIRIIADISCDINGPVASTIRSSSISNPFYDFNPSLEKEESAFSNPDNITVMAVDNLPGELPRDASRDFGNQLIQNILHDLFSGTGTPMIERATILRNGKLTSAFNYLNDYLNDATLQPP